MSGGVGLSRSERGRSRQLVGREAGELLAALGAGRPTTESELGGDTLDGSPPRAGPVCRWAGLPCPRPVSCGSPTRDDCSCHTHIS